MEDEKGGYEGWGGQVRIAKSVGSGTAGPGEGVVTLGATEGTDMDAFGTMGTGARESKVEINADVLVVGGTGTIVDGLGPDTLAIREFGLGRGVRQHGMPSFGADDAGEGSRSPSPAGLKGLARVVVILAGKLFSSFRRERRKTAGCVIARFAIAFLNKLENGC